jgi:hypothetical protein
MAHGAPRPLERASDGDAPVQFHCLGGQRQRLRVERGASEPRDGVEHNSALAEDGASHLFGVCLLVLLFAGR